MSKGYELKELIASISKNVSDDLVPSQITYAELLEIEPELKFQIDAKLPLKAPFIVTPKYRVFTVEDIGKKFVFLKNLGGQTYFYLYEMAEQGTNGVPYKFTGSLKGTFTGKLTGTCTDTKATITSGVIDNIEIEQGIHYKGGNA